MFCPQCRSEFRPGFLTCPQCQLDLVEALPEPGQDKAVRLRELADARQAARIAKAGIHEASQMVETIRANGVEAMLTGDADDCAGGCRKGCCGGPKAYVTVLPEDVADAIAILRQTHRDLVASMDEGSLDALDAEVDLDADGEKACPACGARFTGSPEECPDCGLFLGAR